MSVTTEQAAHSHLHRCQKCGTVWGHGNMMQGDVEAHACPKCGSKDQWRVYRGGGPPTAVGRVALAPAARSWSATVLIVLIFVAVATAIVAGVLTIRHELRRA